MSRVLVVFASVDGQTRRIAERIGNALTQAGHAVTLRSAGEGGPAFAIADHDAVLVGASIRYGRHARSLEQAVRARLAPLAFDGDQRVSNPRA